MEDYVNRRGGRKRKKKANKKKIEDRRIKIIKTKRFINFPYYRPRCGR